MTRVLYVTEAFLAAGLAVAAGWAGLWLYRLCAEMPLWLPAVAVAIGFAARMASQWNPFRWLADCHGWLRRRIEER